MKGPAVTAGALLTLAVHGALVAFLLLYEADPPPPMTPRLVTAPSGSVRHGLCGLRRCSLPEVSQPRLEPEPPPVDELEILEAALMPALGFKEPDPTEMPKLQAYEQHEIVEEGVNLEKENEPPEEEKKKAFDPEKAKRDPKNKAKLDDILKDFEDDDPRKRPTQLQNIIGHQEGEVGGQGNEAKAGNLYAAKVARQLRKDFEVPPIDADTLKGLRVRVIVDRMSLDGSIVSYRVSKTSGNRGFDDAALAAVKLYVPSQGGRKTLPEPDADVLRYINAKGMKIDLDGRLMNR